MNRLKSIQKIRKDLNNGGYSIGTWMQIPHPSIAEIIGQSGYDWVAIDMEHGTISAHQLPDLFRALELGNTLPLVRLAQGHPKDCKRALDAGAGGIIVPMVETAGHLKMVRDACCWPPNGNRGVGFSRANLFGKNFDEYAIEAQQPFLVAMIEDIKAVEELESILKVDGLDAILIGPYDLSASIGRTADFEHPDFLSVMNEITQIAKNAKIPYGIHIVEPDKTQLQLKFNEGYRFLAYSVDSVFINKAAIAPVILKNS
ncbi:aldolase/citrate lyase family protein [Candidatus Thioglobus sp.]|nr:aldolase/citrate lyase family protein [Candidatus Thioglobus sp.]MDA8872026.1 aldolase/citrate lyase family protein [Candidatus Thioglobus sp.]